MTRRRALAMLAVSLVVVLGGAVTVNAAGAPRHGPAPAQPAPTPPPTASPTPPASTGFALPSPASPTVPCTGEGCVPQPTTSAPTPSDPGTGPSGDNDSSSGDADCGITNISGCITGAITAFFRGIATAALNPLLDLLSKTLLTTPTPESLPRVGELWNNSWQILLACYGLLILIAGILVMSYETVQTRHSIKEIAPRIVVGFLAGALSLWVATKGIEIANALAQAVMGGGVDAGSAGATLRDLILGSLNGGIFVIFIGLFLAGMLIALLVTYIVLSRHTTPRLSDHDLAHLGAYHAAARLVLHGEQAQPFTLRTQSLPRAIPGRAREIRGLARHTLQTTRRASAAGAVPPEPAPRSTTKPGQRPAAATSPTARSSTVRARPRNADPRRRS